MAGLCHEAVAPAGQPVLELAGGSGFLAVLLAQAGYQVTDFDLSDEMLSLAAEKAEEADAQLTLIQGDMRDLSDLPPVPVVTCFDDSICYMANLEEVQQSLHSGSVFAAAGRSFFSMRTRYIKWTRFSGYMYNYQTDDFAFLWHSFVGEVPHSVEHDLTFFLYDEALDAYKPLTETQRTDLSD